MSNNQSEISKEFVPTKSGFLSNRFVRAGLSIIPASLLAFAYTLLSPVEMGGVMVAKASPLITYTLATWSSEVKSSLDTNFPSWEIAVIFIIMIASGVFIFRRFFKAA